jgi:hypothetical protein
MVTFFVLTLLAMGALAVAAVIGFVFMLLRAVLWLLFLPIRLLFLPIKLLLFPVRLLMSLLWIPIGLAFGALGLAAGAVLVPMVLVGVAGFVIVSLIAAVLSVMLPMVPFLLLGLLVWAIFRHRPAVPA